MYLDLLKKWLLQSSWSTSTPTFVFFFFCNCISIEHSTKTLKGSFCCQVQRTRRLISLAYTLIIYIYILFVYHRHRWPRFKHRIHWESDSFSQMSYNLHQRVLLLLKTLYLPCHFLHVPNEKGKASGSECMIKKWCACPPMLAVSAMAGIHRVHITPVLILTEGNKKWEVKS